jgi:Flp pilus assembly protein TadG
MRPRGDAGNAIVEFVFVAVIVLVPLVYVVVGVATVQRSRLAVSQAARDAGRAFATSESESVAAQRVRVAVRLAMTSQDLSDDAEVRFVAAGSACTSAAVEPRLAPGAEFAVCVTRRVDLPGVPTLVGGRGITTVGRYVVHVDDYRTVQP